MVGVQGTSDPNPQLLDAMAMCGHLVARDSVHWFLAEHRQRLFPDDIFADLFASGRGRPSVPADVAATVMVLQALEGLSDRDAVAQLRMNIAWKVAAGRPLHDEGFHSTVLTLWRNKLRVSERPQRIFDAVREVIDATNVLAGKTRRALDSTVLDDGVTRQDAIMQLVAQIRRVRRLIPAAKALTLVAHDYDNDPGKPQCAWNDRADIDPRDRVGERRRHDPCRARRCRVGRRAGRSGRPVGVGCGPRCRTRRYRWDVADRAGDACGPGRVSRRSGVAPYSQDHFELSRRVQSPCRCRTRHRADHRL